MMCGLEALLLAQSAAAGATACAGGATASSFSSKAFVQANAARAAENQQAGQRSHDITHSLQARPAAGVQRTRRYLP